MSKSRPHNGTVAADERPADYVARGEALFDALPASFSFDNLMEAAETLGIPTAEAIEHLRIMLREELITAGEITFRKSTVTTHNR